MFSGSIVTFWEVRLILDLRLSSNIQIRFRKKEKEKKIMGNWTRSM
jgi:hypothetical protein